MGDTPDRPALCCDPAWRSGEVCFTSEPRIWASLVTELCIGHGIEEVRGNGWNLTDRDILVACWWTITHEWVRRGDRRTALGRWAWDAHQLLWSARGPLPDFPPVIPGWTIESRSGAPSCVPAVPNTEPPGDPKP